MYLQPFLEMQFYDRSCYEIIIYVLCKPSLEKNVYANDLLKKQYYYACKKGRFVRKNPFVSIKNIIY